MEDIFEEIVALRRRGEQAVLATVVNTNGSVPRQAGAKMLILPSGQIMGTVGGGFLEHQVMEKAIKLIGGSEPKLMHIELTNEDASKEGMICGGTVDVFVEPITPFPALLIFGGGHISFFLARMGKMLGFHVVVIDDRPEYANAERFPDADEIIAEEMNSVMKRIDVRYSSYIVIVTRGHLNDAQVLEWAITTPAVYVGMIGSKKKVQAIFSDLETKGIPRERLSLVHAPIGLAIGSETPEEIAVSIIAEIIQVYRKSDLIRKV
ncbi:MAG: putative xanthine dehydrogenase subunit [Thermoproteota archaeon]|nr:putative xanthine dehydrogenase subunit [Thermoproteota archaeon]